MGGTAGTPSYWKGAGSELTSIPVDSAECTGAVGEVSGGAGRSWVGMEGRSEEQRWLWKQHGGVGGGCKARNKHITAFLNEATRGKDGGKPPRLDAKKRLLAGSANVAWLTPCKPFFQLKSHLTKVISGERAGLSRQRKKSPPLIFNLAMHYVSFQIRIKSRISHSVQ